MDAGRRPTIPWIMTRSGVRCQRRRRSPRAKESGRLSGPSASGISEGDPTRPEGARPAPYEPGIDFAASRRPTRYESCHSPHQVPILVRPLEHQHRVPTRSGLRSARRWNTPISSRPTKNSDSTPSSSTTTTSSRPTSTGRARMKGVAEVKKILDGEGLFVEIIAPRLWEDPRHDRRRLHLEQPRRPQVCHRSLPALRRYRPRGRLQELRPLAGARRAATSARPSAPRRPSPGSSTPGTPSSSTTRKSASSARPSPTSRWTKPTFPPVGHMIGVAYKTVDPQPFGRLDRERPLDPGRPRPRRRHGLRPLSRQALERAPQRPERPEVRPGQGLRLGRPPAGPSTRSGSWRRTATAAMASASGSTSRPCGTTTFEESKFHLAHSKTMFLRLLDIVRGIEAKVEELRQPSSVRAARDADPERPDGWLSGQSIARKPGIGIMTRFS